MFKKGGKYFRSVQDSQTWQTDASKRTPIDNGEER